MTHDIPPIQPPDQTPPIRSLDDLDAFWRSIKGPWGFSAPQVWCSVFGPGGVVTPILIKVEDCPDVPAPGDSRNLLDRITEVVDEFAVGGSAAFMFARPGADDQRASDREWARDLTEAARRASIDVWPVFLANDSRVRIVAPDDLAA
jgi:hypothetical protein